MPGRRGSVTMTTEAVAAPAGDECPGDHGVTGVPPGGITESRGSPSRAEELRLTVRHNGRSAGDEAGFPPRSRRHCNLPKENYPAIGKYWEICKYLEF